MATQLTLLAQAIVATEELLVLAQAEKWEELTPLNQSRQQVIQQINLSDTPAKLAPRVQKEMNRLIALNEQLTTYCAEKRSEAMVALGKMNQSHKVKKAYS